MLGYNGKYCSLDVESSKFPSGLPWQDGYFLSVVSIVSPTKTKSWLLTHKDNENDPCYFNYIPAINEIQNELDKYDVIAGHNLKYDINVLKYFGVDDDFESTS